MMAMIASHVVGSARGYAAGIFRATCAFLP
ncbi:MAG: hypothetical protein UY67_C0001G0060 [Candidatus Kaiserbacteria bacterium GW2011_GWA2_52_12]|uniref:Uncharacterized protein n=1 Tax=Candidatus Kaiserbacteria bacterium GW2011_GWA2_52_12 TaxID=1618671 RepID=A0A0G1X1S6_9BACT|nr:MAG: hypothetical protein UY67_C0001G0060 [Candidatus Kaiserbacteria bacterium GW2011_GWA2_52_12]